MTNNNSKKTSPIKWIITVSILTFLLSLFFSFISNIAINGLAVVPAILVLLLVILVGIIFDLIGVATTIAKEEEFHAMAAKKIKGAKEAIKLIRNSPKVSNICADVIGDICGVLSGSLSAMITLKLTENYGVSSNIQIILSALVAALTVGGKAFTKELAKKNPTKVVFFVSKLISRK
jgi:CBS domain containing-hemolysin-like protein